ncbi:hypothetical protein WDU94_006599 [Cyamophila willieti]
MLAYLYNFLFKRYFKVKCGDTFSNSKIQENGISQGSPLSGTLFNIALSDIASCLPVGVLHGLFVDDLFLVASHPDILYIQVVLQDALNNLSSWSSQNGLRFSPEKSCCINFTRRTKNIHPPLTLNGYLLEYKTSQRLLGLHLDAHLTFRVHIELTKAKAIQALNSIKMLNNKKYGVNRSILTRIYKTCIRPILDYGSSIYDSASETNLQKIEVVQNLALRLISGALRSSPVVSLRADSGIPPLHMRRKELIANYVSKIKENPNNPGFDVFFKNPYIHIPHLFDGKRKPTWLRALDYFHDINFSSLEVLPRLALIPPWELSLPETHLLLKDKKANVSPLEIQTTFLQFCHNHHTKEFFFCDGSKSMNHTGCAFVHQDRAFNFKLPLFCSNFTAEVLAVHLCIQHIRNHHISNSIIFSDSKSLIQSLRQVQSSNVIISRMQEDIHELKQKGSSIQLVWIPGHCGIRGNDLADQAAKNVNTSSSLNLMFPRDLNMFMKKKWKNIYTREWLRTNKHLRFIKQDVIYWSSSNRKKRTEEVVLARLRIGHTRISHSYLMERKERPICDLCQVPLDVEHLLLSCPKFDQDRRTLLPNPSSLSVVLGDNPQHIDGLFKFLYKTKLFHAI